MQIDAPGRGPAAEADGHIALLVPVCIAVYRSVGCVRYLLCCTAGSGTGGQNEPGRHFGRLDDINEVLIAE
jgi:hypothetical protein